MNTIHATTANTYPFCGDMDAWLGHACGAASRAHLPEALRAYQLKAVRATLQQSLKSSFYRQHFYTFSADIRSGLWPTCLEELSQLPCTTAADLVDWQRFLCASQGDIKRMVSLHTSGTTGPAKRLAFSELELERSHDFFAVGMGHMVAAGERVLVLLPGADKPDGVADLLLRALASIGVQGFAGQPACTAGSFFEELERVQPQCLVAAPSQIARLLQAEPTVQALAQRVVHTVLCSAEPLCTSLRRGIEKAWQCEVFDHYGLTESGYGGGVECQAHSGYHLREADLWFDIEPLENEPGFQALEKAQGTQAGPWGQVVLTTISRSLMPLVRYRTGDYARWLAGPCPCGSPLRRLDTVKGRLQAAGPKWELLIQEKGYIDAR